MFKPELISIQFLKQDVSMFTEGEQGDSKSDNVENIGRRGENYPSRVGEVVSRSHWGGLSHSEWRGTPSSEAGGRKVMLAMDEVLLQGKVCLKIFSKVILSSFESEGCLGGWEVPNGWVLYYTGAVAPGTVYLPVLVREVLSGITRRLWQSKEVEPDGA